MTKTKTQRALAFITIAALSMTQFGTAVAATTIGTATVSGQPAFDTNVVWDDVFPGTATGTVSGIVVTATVAPTLNMTVSTGAIDLGTLSAAAYSSGSVNIEIGTNAVQGVSITARSGSGGLTNLSDNSIQINNATTDGVQENYKFQSATGAVMDSTVTGFTNSASLDSEVTDNTTEHLVYTSSKPEQALNLDDVVFTVAAKANAQTPAGNYKDTITFTVTGNF